MLDELCDAVPPELPNLRETVHHLSPLNLNTQICFYFNELDRRIGVQDTPSTPCLRANRPKFRQWLSTNIPIQWSKQVDRVETTDDGKVSVGFLDGSSAIGDVLVGADGVHSVGK
jgi:flavin-dependent dehydrogenase